MIRIIFTYIAFYLSIGFLIAIIPPSPIANKKVLSLNIWKTIIAWLPAFFVTEIRRWINDKQKETKSEKLKIDELFKLKHGLEDSVTNLIREFEERTGLTCKEIALFGKENKVVYLITEDK